MLHRPVALKWGPIQWFQGLVGQLAGVVSVVTRKRHTGWSASRAWPKGSINTALKMKGSTLTSALTRSTAGVLLVTVVEV
jgi:hypothetical protein